MEACMTLEVAFGQILREIRQDRKISQEKLGFESGYHRTYIGLLERGKKNPSLTTIFNITNSLNIKASDLIERIEKRMNSQSSKPQK